MQRGELVHRIKELHKKYGDIVRTALNELSFISGNAFHQLYGHRTGHGTTPKSPLWYGPVPNGFRSIFGVNEADHSRLRRLLSHSFSDKALGDQEPILQSHVNILVDTFRKRATNELCLGESFECVKNAKFHPWASKLFSHFEALPLFTVFRYFNFPGMEEVLQLILPKSVTARCMDHFHMTKEMVHNRLARDEEGKQPKNDFLGLILPHNDDKISISVPEIEANINDILLAGSETTATALTGITNFLLQNPKELEKLVREIRT
ncbi:hypothetical protein OEA41_010139 [Lepraria neglecta]|uniref:Cytochrome P450 n=1 Tax=Lepraria neglecta TaxID=209136 RepID=A0AAD9YW06_9LECA|nr:hypothetical protein OEA41_010139 [Lepraria neglecta]